MRAVDCKDPGTHEDRHFTAETDEGLVRQVEEHIRRSHPDMEPEQAKGIVAENAYDE